MIALFWHFGCVAIGGEQPVEGPDVPTADPAQEVPAPAVEAVPPSPAEVHWPDWLLETTAPVTAEVSGGPALPAGAVLAPVAETEDRYIDLRGSDTVFAPPAAVRWSTDWRAAHGALATEVPEACAAAGAAPDCQLPAIAEHADGRLLLRLPSGAGVITTGTLARPVAEASAPLEPDLYLHPRDAVVLDCPEVSLTAELRAVGPAIATAARDEEVEIEMAGQRIWLQNSCVAGGVARVANLTDPPRTIRGPRLIHFWASWCVPCVAELDAYAAFAAAAGQRAIAVSEDFRRGSAHAFLSRRGFAFESWFDSDGTLLARLGGAEGLPATMVVDPAGKVLRTWVGSTDWSDPALLAEIGVTP